MVPYSGDFAEDATVYILFNTFSSDDPSASVTITNLVDADVKIHKDAGLTQIATDGATIAIDYDGITGNHLITIDTSAHADYSVGSDYQVRIEGTTVDAGTVNAFVGTFSIENRFNAAADDLANVTDGLGALKALIDTLTTNVATVDTVVDTILVDTATTIPGTIATIDANVDAILVDTGTTIPATISTAQADLDIITGASGVNLLTATQASIDAIETDTGTTIPGTITTVDANVDAILVDTGTTLQAELDAIQAAVITNAAGVDIAADIIAIKAETASILTDTGTTLPATLTTIDTVVDGIQTDLDNGTDGLGAIKADTAAVLVDTGTTLPASIATVDANVDAILVDTGTTIPATIATAQTDLDTLTDTRGEPAQGAPAVTASTDTKVDWLYKAWRNKSTQTATTYSLYDDAGSTVDSKATVSDDGTVATKNEVVTGP